MSTQRKRYSAEFKARVALDAVKGLKTVNELASTYGVHPTQITHWKHQLQKEVPADFLGPTGQARARPGSAASPVIPTNRATQSRVGLVEKKSWTCHLRPNAG